MDTVSQSASTRSDNAASQPVTPANGTDKPLSMTEKAAQQVASLLGNEPGERGLRIFVEAGGCSGLSYGMELNTKQPGDEQIDQFGVKLFVDQAGMNYLKGSVIDYADGLSGAGFRITNPNARHTCGCGTSFEA
jgi:iron-sulfur cluster assembly protein